MDQDSNCNCPKDVCEKIYKAVTVCPKNQRSASAARHRNSRKTKGQSEMVPITFDYSIQPPQSPFAPIRNGPAAILQNPDKGTKPNPKVGKFVHTINQEPIKKTGVHIEDSFSEYIHRAKAKIRTVSNVGDKAKPVGVPRKDRFAEYIDRAKLKIRSMSSIGGGRSTSFK